MTLTAFYFTATAVDGNSSCNAILPIITFTFVFVRVGNLVATYHATRIFQGAHDAFTHKVR